MRGRVRELAIELAWRDVDAVEQAPAVEMQSQRDDLDRTRGHHRGRQIGSGVGDDRDRHDWIDSSSGCGSVRRRFLRFLKNRFSIGRIATSVRSTSTAVKMAIR